MTTTMPMIRATANDLRGPIRGSAMPKSASAWIGEGPIQAEVIPQAFCFGPFRIVPRARLLERDGAQMSVGSRAFDLLCVLVSRPGDVISKSELMARVWPDLTVEESNLRFHIARLRRVL